MLFRSGYGAQGGKAEDIARYLNKGNGGTVNSSRGVLLAYKKQEGVAFDEAAYNECVRMKDCLLYTSYTRLATIIFAYLSLIAAFAIPSAALTDMFLALVYSCTVPASYSLIGGLLWKRVNSAAAFSSMICGLLTGLIWQVFSLGAYLEAVYAIAIVTFAVGILVTLCAPRPAEKAENF